MGTDKIFNYDITRHACCGLEFSRNRMGATTEYSRDGLKRVYKVVTKASAASPAITDFTTVDGLTTTKTRTFGSAPEVLFLGSRTRSLNGLSTTARSPDANGDGNRETTIGTTAHNTSTGTTSTTTHPDGTTSVSRSYLDGGMKSSTDQLGHVTTFDQNTHAQNGGGLVTRSTAANGTQWTESYSDPLGRTFKTKFADGAQSTATYHPFNAAVGSRGKTASSTDADGITETYAYNAEGEQTTTTRPMPNGQQSVTVSEQDVVGDAFTGVANRSRTTVNGVLISTSLSGSHGYRTKSIDHLANGSISTSERTVPVDGAWTVTSTSPDGTYRVSTTAHGLTVKEESFGGDDVSIMSSGMAYDAFDRVATTTDSRTGTTTINAYLENGAVGSVTDPGGRTTAFTYDVMGRRLTRSVWKSPSEKFESCASVSS